MKYLLSSGKIQDQNNQNKEFHHLRSVWKLGKSSNQNEAYDSTWFLNEFSWKYIYHPVQNWPEWQDENVLII